jgi:hypothetical protein
VIKRGLRGVDRVIKGKGAAKARRRRPLAEFVDLDRRESATTQACRELSCVGEVAR